MLLSSLPKKLITLKSDTRQGNNSTTHPLSQTLSDTRIPTDLYETLCLLSSAREMLRWEVNVIVCEKGDLLKVLNGSRQRIFLSFRIVFGLLMEDNVQGSFALAHLESTIRQAQECVERANGDIQAVLNVERFSRSIEDANVLGALFEVLRFLSLANKELLDALDEVVRLRNRAQHNISEVNPSETRGLETALIEELRLALLE